MEPESLLPQEQNPSMGPHTQPDEFSIHESITSIFYYYETKYRDFYSFLKFCKE
jgi:hypothetical protein